MVALSNDRDTRSRQGLRRTALMAAGTLIFSGSIVVRNAAGFAAPGTAALGLYVLGIADDQVDNRQGGDGDARIGAVAGTFLVANSSGADEITAASIGQDCFLVDDQTVAKTNGGGTRSVAGRVFDVDAAGVWVVFE